MPLIPVINIKFNAPVWRMEIDETSDTLFLEIRDIPNKQVSFAGINLNTGDLNFSDLTMPERWLSGLEAANNVVLLVNGFRGDTVPVHKGLTGIDGADGTILWTDYNITFEKIVTDGFVVSDVRIQPKKPFVINSLSGQRTASYDPLINTDPVSHIIYPHTITPAGIPFDLPVSVYGNEVHYLSRDKFRIISLHTLEGGVLTQHIYVYNEAGEMLFTDLIAGRIQKLQPEAFITYKNKLIWLKDRSAVKVLNL